MSARTTLALSASAAAIFLGALGIAAAFGVFSGGAVSTARVTVLTSASSVTGGNALDVTVTAKDQFNNSVTSGSTVTITRSSGTGSISWVNTNTDGTYTATISPISTQAGTTIDTAGTTQTLTATIPSNPLRVKVFRFHRSH